jgi:thiamine-phosphate pyrophosphorylase
MRPPFTFCYITDRHGLPDRALPRVLREGIEAGLDMIQIRENDLGTRPLLNLVEGAVAHARGTRTQIVANDRLDVALAAGAAGVHLGTRSLPAQHVRPLVPAGFLVGVSCHSVQDVLDAESAGADYVLLGPIFETPSKRAYGPPLGLRVLGEAATRAVIPIYALGGITVGRAAECIATGATGIGGIRIFQGVASIRERLAEIRAQLTSRTR